MTSFEHEALIFCTITAGFFWFVALLVAAILIFVPTQPVEPLDCRTKEGV